MGFIRGLLLVLVSIILLLSVISSGLFYTISSSLQYERVQSRAMVVVEPIIEQMNLTQLLSGKMSTIQIYCQTSPDFVFNYQGYTLHFPCQDVNDSSMIVNDTIKNFISDLYYQKYDCNYWDCFNKYATPVFLISEKSQNYWYQFFYFSVIATVLSAILMFFLFKRKYDLLFLSGFVLVVASLLIMGIGKILSTLSDQIVSGIAMIFFSQSSFVFPKLLIAGGVLIFAGLIVELFRAGFKIYDMFSRFRSNSEEKEDKVKSEKNKKK